MISPYRIPAVMPTKHKDNRHWKCILFGHKMQLISFLPIIFINRYFKLHPAIGLHTKCIRCGGVFNDTNDAIQPKMVDEDYFVLTPGFFIKKWRFPNGLPKRNIMKW